MSHSGLFVGLITLDFIYGVEKYPDRNQKVVATNSAATAGGPATNAAVTFAHLGNAAELLGGVGSHPVTQLIWADLERWGVNVTDLDCDRTEPPPVSSITVAENTGDRAVVSINATKSQLSPESISADIIEGIDIILIDGHQMALSREIVRFAEGKNIPVVADGGSWKPGFETVLPDIDYIICSANFHPPDCRTETEVFEYLKNLGIPHIAITHGGGAIASHHRGVYNNIEVPQIAPVDTLGAGDIFHGAFCHFILQESWEDALGKAAEVASHSCRYFGTREWMKTGV